MNAAVTFSFDGATADVEEVGGEFAVQLDDIHRSHGKAGTVDHAADIAVELNIGEVIFAGFDFGGVFLGQVAQLGQILVAEHRIAVEANLGVEHQQFVAISPFAHRERVDFNLFGIGAEEGCIKARQHFCRLLGKITGQTQRLGNAAAVMRLQAGCGVDGDGVNFFRGVVGDILDIHPAFGRGDNRDPAGCAVDEEREVEFLLNVGAVSDVKTVDLLAFGPGLDRYQRVAEHFLGMGFDFLDALGQTHAALGIGAQFLELALATTTSMNLRFHHIKRSGQLLGSGNGFLNAQRGNAFGHGNAEFCEQFFRLIFMDIHGRARPFANAGFARGLSTIWRAWEGAGARFLSEKPEYRQFATQAVRVGEMMSHKAIGPRRLYIGQIVVDKDRLPLGQTKT